MTHEEHLVPPSGIRGYKRNPVGSFQEIASALRDMSACATAAISLRQALYNACKIYVHTLEIETRKDLHDLHGKMTDFVFEHPDQTDVLIEATRSRALQL